jgi:type VI secretion system protein ImpG
MDSRLVDYYERELQFTREMGREFARAYPRTAARLGMEDLDCADPYVERLLEGFAFLAARVQLKLDARHPEFTQHLLELIYPSYLCPVPACAVVELAPDLQGGASPDPYVVKRGTSLRTPLEKGGVTACEFRTAHDVTLWPLIVSEARYIAGAGVLSAQGLSGGGNARAAIQLRLKAAPGVSLKALPVESLTFFLNATPGIAARLYEQIMADCQGFLARPALHSSAAHARGAECVCVMGLDDTQALMPVTRRGFQGYRLLQEYYALPERLLFFTLRELQDIFASCEGEELDIFLLLNQVQPSLENAVAAEHFRLGCTPAINLFPMEMDRIQVGSTDTELHIVPDRNRPMDFEIHSIERMRAIGEGGEVVADVRPFYAADHSSGADPEVYYTLQRRPRLISARERQVGTRAHYVGSECFVSIVDSAQRQFSGAFAQLDVRAWCTNRDLPVLLAMGRGATDFHIDGGAPVESVRCLRGPTYPRQSPAFGDTAWKLISHLSLNYLSLVERNPESGAEMLRDFLALYADPNDSAMRRQIEGVRGVSYRPVVRRLPDQGPLCYGRGLELSLVLDDAAFEGTGILPLAMVLETFFARYVSLNSFTQTQLHSTVRGPLKTWPIRLGRRELI